MDLYCVCNTGRWKPDPAWHFQHVFHVILCRVPPYNKCYTTSCWSRGLSCLSQNVKSGELDLASNTQSLKRLHRLYTRRNKLNSLYTVHATLASAVIVPWRTVGTLYKKIIPESNDHYTLHMLYNPSPYSTWRGHSSHKHWQRTHTAAITSNTNKF